MYPFTINWLAPNTTYTAPLQNGVADTPLTLTSEVVSLNFQYRPVSLTSVNNLSAINFTIAGLLPSGLYGSEVLAGPNANTVQSTNFFKFVTSITPDNNAAQVSAGYGSGGVSEILGGSRLQNSTEPYRLNITVTGTITYTAEYTISPIYVIQQGSLILSFDYANLAWVPLNPTLTGATTTINSAFSDQPIMGLRLNGNVDPANTGTLVLQYLAGGK